MCRISNLNQCLKLVSNPAPGGLLIVEVAHALAVAAALIDTTALCRF